MKVSVQTKLHYWWIAIKLPSLLKIILPIGLGVAIGTAVTHEIHLEWILGLIFYAWFLQLYIILFNDYADVEADTLQRTQFPHLSTRRVIPEGLLTKQEILIAGLLSVGVLILIGGIFTLAFLRWHSFLLLGISLLFFWAYSFPPIRLNYRGWGELLETIGVGFVLPISAFYFYTGKINSFPIYALAPLILISLVSALTSGIKDHPSDMVAGKKTFAVLYGIPATKRAILVVFALSILASIALSLYLMITLHPLFGISFLLSAVLPAYFFFQALRLHPIADSNHLKELKMYKRMITRSVYAISGGIILGYSVWYVVQAIH